MNTLAGRVDGEVIVVPGGTIPVTKPSAALPTEIVVGVRPERLTVGTPGGPGVQVRLRVVEALGPEQLLVV